MDMVSRIYCESLKLRAYTVVTKETASGITSVHKTTPNATLALGRTINAAALIAATLKPESGQSVLVKFSGEGPVREVHVQCDAFGNVRGYIANPSPDITDSIGTLSFSKAIGAGFLTIIKDLGMKEPYSSITPLMYGEVAADLAYHLTTSEQVPSAVILGLNIDTEGGISSSGGILIQTFPDTEPEVIAKIENNIKSMPATLGDLLENGGNIHNIVTGLFDNHRTEILSSGPVKHQCRCSHEMLLGLMKTVHRDELMDMIETDKGATVTCTFCRREYVFTEDELKTLIPPA